MTAMQGDPFEIVGGKLAEHKTTNKAVLRLARRLVSDHTKSFDESKALAKKLGIEVPNSPTDSQKWELPTLHEHLKLAKEAEKAGR